MRVQLQFVWCLKECFYRYFRTPWVLHLKEETVEMHILCNSIIEKEQEDQIDPVAAL